MAIICAVRNKGNVMMCDNYRAVTLLRAAYEGWNFNSGNYLFTTDTK